MVLQIYCISNIKCTFLCESFFAYMYIIYIYIYIYIIKVEITLNTTSKCLADCLFIDDFSEQYQLVSVFDCLFQDFFFFLTFYLASQNIGTMIHRFSLNHQYVSKNSIVNSNYKQDFLTSNLHLT